jgi:hypothetical protein
MAFLITRDDDCGSSSDRAGWVMANAMAFLKGPLPSTITFEAVTRKKTARKDHAKHMKSIRSVGSFIEPFA